MCQRVTGWQLDERRDQSRVTCPVTTVRYPARMVQNEAQNAVENARQDEAAGSLPSLPQGPANIRDCDWAGFPGGELEAPRPRVLCAACRGRVHADALRGGGAPSEARRRLPICFQCYRADLARERALKAAGDLDTASVERFQTGLPFEPVNRPRLDMLKAERSTVRASMAQGAARFEERRRRAQFAARRALQQVAARGAGTATVEDRARDMAYAVHAAELQFPESWLPFVMSR
jgi:hypothetical protein